MDPHAGLVVESTAEKFKSELEQESKETQKADRITKAQLLKTQGKSQREIADELGLAVGTINKYLKKDWPLSVHVHLDIGIWTVNIENSKQDNWQYDNATLKEPWRR